MVPTPPLSVAPMMDRTDRHFRFLLRLLSRHTLLYTEMVTAAAVLRGRGAALLAYDPSEHPLAVQLGGDEPADLAAAAAIAEDLGYDEVNLNVGCPSSRVQSGAFGACLMRTPQRVADCVAAMKARVDVPVTVKHRIGVDELDAYSDMLHFVDVVAAAGADRFTVHARKAWLQGLSPKENRTIPPLRYPEVHRLKAERPHLQIEINGGITTLETTLNQLEHVDGVMIGRAAWDNPWLFARADSVVFHQPDPVATRREAVAAYRDYAARWLAADTRNHLGPVARPTINLFCGVPGSRWWRRVLSERIAQPAAGVEVFDQALEAMAQAAAASAHRWQTPREGAI